MRAIDAENLVMDVLGLTIVDPSVAMYADAVLRRISNAPTITYEDLVPHGRWIFEPATATDDKSGYRCSVCMKTKWHSEDVPQAFKHCPDCGAKMDGGNEK